MKRLLAALAVSAALSGPAVAVGLGPLVKEGVTDGPAKGFYLTLINPYQTPQRFTAYAIAPDSDAVARRVKVPAGPIALAGKAQRKLLVVAEQMQPGETYKFRVCAERIANKEEMVRARVCSRLSARRLAVRG